jgi:hypothetical protein
MTESTEANLSGQKCKEWTGVEESRTNRKKSAQL